MAVLKAASDGAAQACGGRRFQITAARYEKGFCEAVLVEKLAEDWLKSNYVTSEVMLLLRAFTLVQYKTLEFPCLICTAVSEITILWDIDSLTAVILVGVCGITVC